MHFERTMVDSIERINLIEDNKVLLAVAPWYGARLTGLKLKKADQLHDVLWAVSDSDLRTNEWYKHTILFPFPNRVEDGVYEYKGKTYQFPINEPDKNNQLHGMLHSAPFVEQAASVSNGEASISFVHEYSGEKAYFPFPFTFNVTYHYKDGALNVTFSVKNTGTEEFPFGIGWHPYFQFDEEKILDCGFSAKQLTRLELNERSIPTGEKTKLERSVFDFSKDVLDDAFTVDYTPVAYELTKGESLKLQIEASDSMGFLQIFTPDGGDAVAVEPMTCNINMLNNGDGMLKIAPGDSFESSVSLKINF